LRVRGESDVAKQDLRELVQRLARSGDLVEVSRQVDVVHELAAVAHAVEEERGSATLFRNLPDHPGVSVLSGIASTYQLIASSLETDVPGLKRMLLDSLARPLGPSHNTEDPVERIIWSGSGLDLFRIPIPTHAPKDAGPYITGGIVAVRDAESGRMNYSYHRMLRLDRTHLSIMINPGRHLDDLRIAAQKAGMTIPVAVVIGVHPAVMVAAAMRYPGDELEIAGRLLGEPVETAPSGPNDLPIPVFSEYMLEGVIDPAQRVEEGPMGEFTGIYGLKSNEYLLEISAISHRPQPIYQTILPAGREHKVLGATLPREPVLLKSALTVSPDVKDVYIPPYGSGLLAVVVFDPTYEGQAKNVGLAALSAYTTIKSVIVVNSDVDVYNAQELIWTVVTRADLGRDLAVLPHFLGHPLDPAALGGLVTKSIIDAARLPGDPTLDRVTYGRPTDLDDYLKRDR
jgi:2,5-furandicarboxylate decarboxylase 1